MAIIECPECPWSGFSGDEYINHENEVCCPRCGVQLDAPRSFTSLENLILFAFTLNPEYLNRGTKYEDT